MSTNHDQTKKGAWRWHVYLFVYFTLMMVLLIPVVSIDTQGVLEIYVILSIGMAIFGFLSLASYYWDAKQLQKGPESWSPFYPAWMIGHILFSPFFISPIYVLYRHFRVGNDWSHLKFWAS